MNVRPNIVICTDQGESLGALLSQGPVTPALTHLVTDNQGFGRLSEDDFVHHFGATSGIGRTAAGELGRRGAEVVVHGRNPVRGSAVAGAITAEGRTARFVPPTSATRPSWKTWPGTRARSTCWSTTPGFSWFGPTAEFDVATFDRLFATNVRAPYFLVAACCRRWAPGEAAASSASGAWPARSAWPAAPPEPPWRQ